MRLGRIRWGMAVALASTCVAVPCVWAYGGFPGQIDPKFGGTGSVPLREGGGPAQVDVVPGEGILVTVGPRLLKLHPDGTTDSSFGNAGEVTLPFSAHRVRHDASGRIVVLASSHYPSLGCLVRRYTPGGEPDESFGDGGAVALPRPRCIDLAVDGNRIVVLGHPRAQHPNDPHSTRITHFGVARLLPDGRLDESFMLQGFGWRRFDPFPYARPSSIAVDSRRRPVIGGVVFRANRPYLVVARFTREGGFDKAFSRDGKVRVPARRRAGAYDASSAHVGLAVGPGGGITAVCSLYLERQFRSCLLRLRPDGRRAAGFAGDGFRWVGLIPYLRSPGVVPAHEQLPSLALGRNGRILVGGRIARRIDTVDGPRWDYYSAMARFKKNGGPDRAFWNDGSFVGKFFRYSTSETVTGLYAQDRARTIVAMSRSPAINSSDQFLLRMFD